MSKPGYLRRRRRREEAVRPVCFLHPSMIFLAVLGLFGGGGGGWVLGRRGILPALLCLIYSAASGIGRAGRGLGRGAVLSEREGWQGLWGCGARLAERRGAANPSCCTTPSPGPHVRSVFLVPAPFVQASSHPIPIPHLSPVGRWKLREAPTDPLRTPNAPPSLFCSGLQWKLCLKLQKTNYSKGVPYIIF